MRTTTNARNGATAAIIIATRLRIIVVEGLSVEAFSTGGGTQRHYRAASGALRNMLFHHNHNIPNIALMDTQHDILQSSNAMASSSSSPYEQVSSSTTIVATAAATATTVDTDNTVPVSWFAATIPDVLQTLVLGLVVLALVAALGATYVTQSYLPGQLNGMALLVKEEDPDAWTAIAQQLEPGQRVRDRPDLMAQLTQAALELMERETLEELQNCIELIQTRQRQRQNEEDSDDTSLLTNTNSDNNLRTPLEATLGTTLEEFCAKVRQRQNQDDNASSSSFSATTSVRVELADLIEQELLSDINNNNKEP
mmetsp:Transcript_12559/g.34837  ORF Transcript_12559/g.34837 Transcript_12559/m.34837 type:complete len:311 (-) Transcript_12559:138-1070(-)